MVRTQVQLPDEMHARLRALAEQMEWSFAETVRRAAERLLLDYPADPLPPSEWSLPLLDVGEVVADYEDFRRLANEQGR